MVWKQKSLRQGLASFLCLALVFWTVSATAQQIGDWSGYFANLSGPDYFDHPMDVPQDGSVTLVTTVNSTFLDQFSSTRILDNNLDTIDFTLLMTSPKTFVVPLAAGSYTVRIGRGLQDKYGPYTITADLAPASPGATETENNDLLADANTNPNNLFAGAIGHIRAKNVQDLSDYYRFSLTGDTNVHFDLTTADTLMSSNTSLNLKNGSEANINFTYLSVPSKTWDLFLAAGTYYLRVYIADWSKYGGYSIATTTTPAVAPSAETENNDAMGAANPIKNKTLLGSIGYMRTTGFCDDSDYFSCQVTQGGTLTAEILPAASLQSTLNAFYLRNGNGALLDSATLSGSPRSVSVNHLDAGTYYLQVYRAVKQGAYQINISGNVILSGAVAGSTLTPLLLAD